MHSALDTCPHHMSGRTSNNKKKDHKNQPKPIAEACELLYLPLFIKGQEEKYFLRIFIYWFLSI